MRLIYYPDFHVTPVILDLRSLMIEGKDAIYNLRFADLACVVLLHRSPLPY